MVHSDGIWKKKWNYNLEIDTNFENKGVNWSILSLFDTMFWLAEKCLKAVKLNGAFWRFLRPMLNDFQGMGVRPLPLEPLVHKYFIYS